MATPSTVLAWEIPWTEEPGGLQSMGLQRVRHNLGTKQQQEISKKCVIFSQVFFFFLTWTLYKTGEKVDCPSQKHFDVYLFWFVFSKTF